jgi:hypothetical protein
MGGKNLLGYTVKTNTTDIQIVDSVYSKTIHQEMEEDHKTKRIICEHCLLQR